LWRIRNNFLIVKFTPMFTGKLSLRFFVGGV
jgi:hypothetical protein